MLVKTFVISTRYSCSEDAEEIRMNLSKGRLKNFDGRIGHVVDFTAPSSFFVSVIPEMSDETKERVDKAIASNVDSIQPVSDSNDLESGSFSSLTLVKRFVVRALFRILFGPSYMMISECSFSLHLAES